METLKYMGHGKSHGAMMHWLQVTMKAVQIAPLWWWERERVGAVHLALEKPVENRLPKS